MIWDVTKNYGGRNDHVFLCGVLQNIWSMRLHECLANLVGKLILGKNVISKMASLITSVVTVCSNVCSGTDLRKHQSSASLAFVRGIHRWPVNSLHKGPVTRKMFPFDDVIMMTTFASYIYTRVASKELRYIEYWFLNLIIWTWHIKKNREIINPYNNMIED